MTVSIVFLFGKLYFMLVFLFDASILTKVMDNLKFTSNLISVKCLLQTIKDLNQIGHKTLQAKACNNVSLFQRLRQKKADFIYTFIQTETSVLIVSLMKKTPTALIFAPFFDTHLEEVVSDSEREIRLVLDPGSEHAGAVPVLRHRERVINRDPVFHVIPERLKAEVSVIPENPYKLRVAPTTEGLLQVIGQVPVVERDHRLHADPLQPLDERPVVVGADFIVTPAGAVGKDPGPGQGEPVVADPELLDGSDVGADVVVAVAADVPGRHPVPTARKSVPNGEPLSVLLERALHLVRRRAHRPYEALGESIVEENFVTWIGQFTEASPRF